MIEKVIFFRYLPLTKKVYSDFFLEELINAGFKVEYWYLPFIITVPNGMEEYDHPCVKRFYSYTELEKALIQEDLTSTLFNSIQTYGEHVLRLFWLMTKYKCRLSVFGRNTLPMYKKAPTAKKISDFTFTRVKVAIERRLAFFLKKYNFIKSYDILFLGGSNGINGYGYVTEKEKNKSIHIPINGDDYDRYMRLKSGERFLSNKYIVFLDECMPLHPDSSICGIKTIDPDIYYQEINTFFDRIENETGLPVVIAAHPKALVYKNHDYFNGREVIFEKTAELVRDSEFVLAHDSTAIGYVVCFEKPMISLTSDEFAKQQMSNHNATICMSNYLGTNLVYINRYCEGDSASINFYKLKADRSKYKQYKYEFLTNPETENCQSSTLVVEGLKQIK